MPDCSKFLSAVFVLAMISICPIGTGALAADQGRHKAVVGRNAHPGLLAAGASAVVSMNLDLESATSFEEMIAGVNIGASPLTLLESLDGYGSIGWVCSASIEDNLLPKSCRENVPPELNLGGI